MSSVERIVEVFRANPHQPMRILGASGQLGYGIPTAPFEAGLDRQPHLIGCDMGSIDIGPYYLGSGRMAPTRSGAKRDLRKVLTAAVRRRIPLVIGSAGSAGARPHLEATLGMIREIAAEEALAFRLAWIEADIDPGMLQGALAAGRIRSLDGMPPLREGDIEAATHIVGQMGLAAFRRAVERMPDVVVAGRACDTAIFATLPILLGFPAGTAIHLAKIIECASICCEPGGRDTILATLDHDGFVLESMNPDRRATPVSVAAHALYEQADPYTIIEPEGRVDLTHARYEAVDERRTRVSGARWEPAAEPTIKLEGACLVGMRGVLLAASADPIFIARQETIMADLKTTVRNLVSEGAEPDYELMLRVYGCGAVRPLGTAPEVPPTEVFILGECIAPTAERAQEVLRTARQYLLHHGYEGRLSTAGNLAFPFTPPEIEVGPAYRLNIHHLLAVSDPAALFPIHVEDHQPSGV